MGVLLENAWLAAFIPATLAAALFVLGKRGGKAVAWIAMLGPASVALTGMAAAGKILSMHAEALDAPYTTAVVSAGSTLWMVQGQAAISMGYAVDGLTAIMLLVVGVVAFMVMLFSVGYMAGDEGFHRYYTLLSLFTASMTALVLADNLVGVFLSWELVGVCSYLLIGFWYHKPSASAAAMKAFLVTRVGDVGLFLGLALLWKATGGLGLASVMLAVPGLDQATVTTAALLVFTGAVGKSAQFPLHLWLPDAMEGPTPVSALIHAATMVAAGVFLVARTWPLFEASAAALQVVLAIGVITAFGAATIALGQTDIKRVLAYSTISQLGFMFAALGAGAPEIAMFHLVTHAAFKALLFLASGSVIHGSGTQNMHEMGGLAKKMKVTAVTWIVGVAALSGLWPLSGFWSKDEVVASVLDASGVAGFFLLAASALTAIYSFRATRMTFFGEHRGSGHPHESPASMLVPLVSLGALAAVLGFAGHQIAELMGTEAHALNPVVAVVSLSIAVGGSLLGFLLFPAGERSDERAERVLGPAWRYSKAAYGYDALVDAAVVRPTVALARVIYEAVDRFVVDGVVEGAGVLAKRVGGGLARLQTGEVQWYAALMGGGAVILLVVAMWAVR